MYRVPEYNGSFCATCKDQGYLIAFNLITNHPLRIIVFKIVFRFLRCGRNDGKGYEKQWKNKHKNLQSRTVKASHSQPALQPTLSAAA